jgi:hypothetical protein
MTFLNFVQKYSPFWLDFVHSLFNLSKELGIHFSTEVL